ncbi:MAG: hypothetical protein K9J21_07235 [Bacteroidales bacterium]|nr:hypothetical protein [Bacteroidales bacterium]
MTPEQLNKKEKYLVIDPFEGDHETYETIEEAREAIEEVIHDHKGNEDGIPLDAEGFAIYELKERLYLDTIAERSNYTDEEWSEMGYSNYFDVIVDPKIKEI